jgi:TonB family protein
MPTTYTPGRTNYPFGLLPEPEGRSIGFVTSSIVNLTILGIVLIVGMTAKQVITQHYEMTELIVPTTPPPEIKVKQPPPPKLPPPPEQPKLQMQELRPKQIELPKPKPEPKPVQMEAKVNLPVVPAKPQIVRLQPQPKAALTAAMPAQNSQVKPSTAPVHLGETFGATPNPNATRPATIAAIGNPYGGMQGPAVAPHGVVGSTGIGNGLKAGSNAGVVGRVASAGIPGETGTGNTPSYGRVGSAGIPAATTVAAVQRPVSGPVQSTEVEVLSKPPVVYTSEARQLHVQGDVVLSVTFLASGRVVVNGVLQGLGHGLDEEARRVAEEIRFRPATSNGHPVDVTTKIRITFQLA